MCYADEGVTPEDVAGWFDKPLWWAVQVYTEQDELRRRWPAARDIERQAVGLLPGDPSYAVIRARRAEVISRDPDPCKRAARQAALERELADAKV